MNLLKDMRRTAARATVVACAVLFAGVGVALGIAGFAAAMFERHPAWLALVLTGALTLGIALLVFLSQMLLSKPPPARSKPSLANVPTPVLTLITAHALRLLRRHPKAVLGGATALGLAIGLLLYAGPPDVEDDEDED